MNIIPKWSAIKKIQQLRIVKSMYVWLFVVPIIAKFFSKLEDVVNVTIFNYTFNLQLGLPFSWKVFYYSALLFVFANLIFLFRCFTMIKDYNNLFEFDRDGREEDQILDYLKEASLKVRKYAVDQFEKYGIKISTKNSQRFWVAYNVLDNDRKRSRILCSGLYLGAFIMISIILFQNLMVVIEFTFRNLQ